MNWLCLILVGTIGYGIGSVLKWYRGFHWAPIICSLLVIFLVFLMDKAGRQELIRETYSGLAKFLWWWQIHFDKSGYPTISPFISRHLYPSEEAEYLADLNRLRKKRSPPKNPSD